MGSSPERSPGSSPGSHLVSSHSTPIKPKSFSSTHTRKTATPPGRPANGTRNDQGPRHGGHRGRCRDVLLNHSGNQHGDRSSSTRAQRGSSSSLDDGYTTDPTGRRRRRRRCPRGSHRARGPGPQRQDHAGQALGAAVCRAREEGQGHEISWYVFCGSCFISISIGQTS